MRLGEAGDVNDACEKVLVLFVIHNYLLIVWSTMHSTEEVIQTGDENLLFDFIFTL